MNKWNAGVKSFWIPCYREAGAVWVSRYCYLRFRPGEMRLFEPGHAQVPEDILVSDRDRFMKTAAGPCRQNLNRLRRPGLHCHWRDSTRYRAGWPGSLAHLPRPI